MLFSIKPKVQGSPVILNNLARGKEKMNKFKIFPEVRRIGQSWFLECAFLMRLGMLIFFKGLFYFFELPRDVSLVIVSCKN